MEKWNIRLGTPSLIERFEESSSSNPLILPDVSRKYNYASWIQNVVVYGEFDVLRHRSAPDMHQRRRMDKDGTDYRTIFKSYSELPLIKYKLVTSFGKQ